MTVQLSALRVSAEMEAGAYTAGAAQKVAADKAMIASSQATAAAFTQTDTKISQSGDTLSRLSRQYVEGYASAQRFNSAIGALSRGFETGKISMQQAEPILDGIYRKYGLLADAAHFAARGQNDFAMAITNANARVAGQQARPAANSNARLSSGQIQGLGYQANDIVTMALLGASPGQIAFSQGGQILQNLQMGEGGISGSLSAIKAGAVDATKATVAFLGTTGLIASGFGVAAAAVGAFYLATREKVKSADEVLKDHEHNIRALKDAYGEAADAAINYGKAAANEGRPGIAIPTAMNEREIRLSLAASSMEAGRSMMANLNGLQGGSQFGPTLNSQFKDFADEIEKYRSSVAKGAPDVLAFRKAVTEKWDLDRNNEELTDEAAAIFKLTDAAAKLQLTLPGAKAALDALNNGRYPGLADVQARLDYEDQANANQYRMQQQFSADMIGLNAKSPQELAAAARAREALNTQGSAAEQATRVELAGKRALIEAEHQLAEAAIRRAACLSQHLATQQISIDFGDAE